MHVLEVSVCYMGGVGGSLCVVKGCSRRLKASECKQSVKPQSTACCLKHSPSSLERRDATFCNVGF